MGAPRPPSPLPPVTSAWGQRIPHTPLAPRESCAPPIPRGQTRTGVGVSASLIPYRA
jgi:hypothetical protein